MMIFPKILSFVPIHFKEWVGEPSIKSRTKLWHTMARLGWETQPFGCPGSSSTLCSSHALPSSPASLSTSSSSTPPPPTTGSCSPSCSPSACPSSCLHSCWLHCSGKRTNKQNNCKITWLTYSKAKTAGAVGGMSMTLVACLYYLQVSLFVSLFVCLFVCLFICQWCWSHVSTTCRLVRNHWNQG